MGHRCLEGVRVVELSHYIAGPFCGQILGDLGADIVKVEQPGAGEAGRAFGPHYKGLSLYYAAFNRNKRTITINLKSEDGRRVLRGLIKKADIFLENFKPDFLEGIGLGYEALEEINPRLITVSVSGFGHNSPYRDRAALDMVIQAMGGIMDLTGFCDGPPVKVGPAIVDFLAGMYGAIGTLAALLDREKTGKGQLVDIAMLDSLVSVLDNNVTLQLLMGASNPRSGNARPTTAPSNAYRATDGYVYIAANGDSLFKKLMKLIGRDEWADDPRMDSPNKRKALEQDLDESIGKWVGQMTVSEAVDRVQAVGIPCGPVSTMKEVVDNPSLISRGMIQRVFSPALGEEIPLAGTPVKLSRAETGVFSAPRLLGQDLDEVLREWLGLDEREVARLRDAKAV